MVHEASLPRNCTLEFNHIKSAADSFLCLTKSRARHLSDPSKNVSAQGHCGVTASLSNPAVYWVWVCVCTRVDVNHDVVGVLWAARMNYGSIRSQVLIGNLSLQWASSVCKQAIHHEPYKDTLTLRLHCCLFTLSRSSAHILPQSVYGCYKSKGIWGKFNQKWTSRHFIWKSYSSKLTLRLFYYFLYGKGGRHISLQLKKSLFLCSDSSKPLDHFLNFTFKIHQEKN